MSAVLIGRDRELGTLRDLLDRAEAGRLSLAVVEGPRGSGKTRLLQEFSAIAHRRGAATVREADWIDGSGMWRIVASGRDDGPSGPGVSTRPRLLTCEHPQWIQTRVWPELEAIGQTVPLVVVVTRRTGEPEFDAHAEAGPHRVTLRPLTGPAVSALLATLVGGLPDPPLRELAEVAGGNPRALEDLVAGLREERLLHLRSGCAYVDAVRLPARTRARLDATLAALSPPTRHLLQVASTIGARFDLRDLAVLLRRGAATLVPAVHEAIASGLVVGVEDTLRFRHELVRATAEESLPRPVRVALREERAPVVRGARPGPGLGAVRPGPGPGVARAGPGVAQPGSGPGVARPGAGANGAQPEDGAGVTEPGSGPGVGKLGAGAGGGEGWAVLSAQEQRIAVLVGDALTNQQIARRIERSPHTVNYHLRQIFRKLNLTSRVELARLARDVPDQDDPGGSEWSAVGRW